MCFESKQICFGIMSGRGDITEGDDGHRCFGRKHVSPGFLCPFLTISFTLGLVSPRTLRDGPGTESDTLSGDTEHEPPEQALKAVTGRRPPNRREPGTEPPSLMERSKTKAKSYIPIIHVVNVAVVRCLFGRFQTSCIPHVHLMLKPGGSCFLRRGLMRYRPQRLTEAIAFWF